MSVERPWCRSEFDFGESTPGVSQTGLAVSCSDLSAVTHILKLHRKRRLTVQNLRFVHSWHPDKNHGCQEARKQFQRVKDAFDEIKRRQTENTRSIYESNRSDTRSHNAGYSYRYTERQTRNPFGTEYGRASYEHTYDYRRARSQRMRTDWGEAAQTVAQARMRMTRPLNLIGYAFAASLVISSAALTTDFVWRANNRGKSFEDLMNSLDTGDNSRASSSRGAERHQRRRPRDNRVETSKP